jgi:hypothetical protein
MRTSAFALFMVGFLALLTVTLTGCGPFTAFAGDLDTKESVDGVVIGPVLQNATPTAIGVMWETDVVAESVVEFGPTPNLGHYAHGTAILGPGNRLIHHVDLTDLSPDTKYYYRVIAATAPGRIQTFRTPPTPGARRPFKFAVYSDCQQQPGTHRQIVDQGIFGSLPDGGDLADEFGFVLVAGDIVQDGDSYRQYDERFFSPIQNVSGSVPYYVAIGNHENNSQHYFNYMNLPRNGTPGFEEHWYSFNYGNAHVIGLDTNNAYSIDAQLAWLDDDLATACRDPNVDMIFAFFHHPYKSELWVPGQHGYSGKIVRSMERHLTACDKVGAFFFGHTHGYSRGQSQDANLYWVNVGSAGGHLDNWGEYEQRDYPEFQKSFDEYGVLIVEANPGGQVGFAAKRLTFGDERVARRGDVQDEFGITSANRAPQTPSVERATWDGDRVVATANAFVDTDSTRHLEAQWQVAPDASFDALLVNDWIRFENWYMDVDTNAGLDLAQLGRELPLAASADPGLWTRVRYRDDQLRWSAWSEARPVTMKLRAPTLAGQ